MEYEIKNAKHFNNHGEYMLSLLQTRPFDFIRTVFDSIYNGIIIFDNEGYIVYYNQSAKTILDLSNESLENNHLSDLSKSAWEEMKTIIKDGEPQYGKRDQVKNKVLYVQRYPIINDGKIIGIISIFQNYQDVEKMLLNIDSCKNIIKELNAIIQSIYDGIYVSDGRGVTIRVNDAWENITGMKAHQVLGRNTADLEKEGYVSKFVTPMIIKEKKPISIQAVTCTNKEVLVSGNPVFDENGNVSMVVGTVRDLTDIKRLMQELKYVKDLNIKYKQKIKKLKQQLLAEEDIVSESKIMKDILESVAHIANYSTPVLITGETGVGKEVIARAIHSNNPTYGKGSLLKINCGAIPESLLEAELFGYEQGAFTGANPKGKPGLLEQAEGGTLLLDEIGELSIQMQSKLLSVLQDYEVTRIGSLSKRKIDLRFIFITNRDLESMVEEGLFRQDLYYRLKVIPIRVPPLRERKEDIPPLLNHYLQFFNEKFDKKIQLTSQTVDELISYDWPGNIREMKNFVENLVIMAEPFKEITPADLPSEVRQSSLHLFLNNSNSLKQAVRDFEVQYIHKAIDKYGTIQEAARRLSINPATIYRKLQK